MKCLFCKYQYKAPNSSVSDVIGHIINHMSIYHENQLEIVSEGNEDGVARPKIFFSD